jgi:hypothetical protein
MQTWTREHLLDSIADRMEVGRGGEAEDVEYDGDKLVLHMDGQAWEIAVRRREDLDRDHE